MTARRGAPPAAAPVFDARAELEALLTHAEVAFARDAVDAPDVSGSVGTSASSTAAGARHERLTPRDAAGLSVQVQLHGPRATGPVGAVRVGPWARVFEASTEDAEDAEDAEAREDARRELLDLVGAALFGELEVEQRWWGGATAWTVRFGRAPGARRQQIARGGAGTMSGVLGTLPRGVARALGARVTVGANALPRGVKGAGARWTRRDLPMTRTPWAGAAGFMGDAPEAAAAPIPLDGELDLHHFPPKQVKPLVLAYIDDCRAAGVLELRVVHGKGKGHLRRTVHAILERHPDVVGFRLGGHGRGGWGATLVDLRPPETPT